MGIENSEKIDLLDIKIYNMQKHIDILEADIVDNPDADAEDKPTRHSVLEDFKLKKNALVLEKKALTNQG